MIRQAEMSLNWKKKFYCTTQVYVQETGVCRREDRYLQNCLVTGEAGNVYFYWRSHGCSKIHSNGSLTQNKWITLFLSMNETQWKKKSARKNCQAVFTLPVHQVGKQCQLPNRYRKSWSGPGVEWTNYLPKLKGIFQTNLLIIHFFLASEKTHTRSSLCLFLTISRFLKPFSFGYA